MAAKAENGAGKMTLQIKFFASLRESVGIETLTAEASSMKGLREQLQASLSHESAAVLYADGVQIAINQKLIAENWRCDDFEISPSAEVAFLPRVTGG